MKTAKTYVDLDGNKINLMTLDAEERRLLGRLRRRARTHPDWCDFDTLWMKEVVGLYDARGLPRDKMRRTPLYRIAQDLAARLGVAAGFIRAGDSPAPHKKTG